MQKFCMNPINSIPINHCGAILGRCGWKTALNLDNPTHGTQRGPFLRYREKWKTSCYKQTKILAITCSCSCPPVVHRSAAPRSPAGFPPPGLGEGPLGAAVPAPAPCAKSSWASSGRDSGTAMSLCPERLKVANRPKGLLNLDLRLTTWLSRKKQVGESKQFG